MLKRIQNLTRKNRLSVKQDSFFLKFERSDSIHNNKKIPLTLFIFLSLE